MSFSVKMFQSTLPHSVHSTLKNQHLLSIAHAPVEGCSFSKKVCQKINIFLLNGRHIHTARKKREALFTRSFGWINTSERPKSLQQQQLRNCGMWYSVFMFKMVEIDKASYYLPSHQVTFLECVFFFSACWWKTLSNLMLLLSL